MSSAWRLTLSISAVAVGALLAITQFISLLPGSDSNLRVAIPLFAIGILLTMFGAAAVVAPDPIEPAPSPSKEEKS